MHTFLSCLKSRCIRGPLDAYMQRRATWMVRETSVDTTLLINTALNIACLGAGVGHECEALIREYPHSRVVAVEPAYPLAPTVQRRAIQQGASITYLSPAVRAERLEGIADTSQHMVTAFFMFHHMQREAQECAIAEAYRVLKSGGVLCIAEDIVNAPSELRRTVFWDRVMNMEVLPSEHNYRSGTEWQQLCTGLGFELVSYHEVHLRVTHGFLIVKKR